MAAEYSVKMTLVTGGVRSGKSHFAQELALKAEPPVLFVATAEAGDEEMRQRIEEHRSHRPKTWRTLETQTGLGAEISQNLGGTKTVLIDCITLLVNNVFEKQGHDGREIDAAFMETAVMEEIAQLVNCIELSPARFIIVTNEVGLGIVPADRMSRLYRDLLGKVNQKLVQHADEVYLLVSGLPLRLKPGGAG